MMDCFTGDRDLDEPTVVIHPAWAALTVLLEAERRSGVDAREFFEDAQRLAAAVSLGRGHP